jgi:hypothetical protein
MQAAPTPIPASLQGSQYCCWQLFPAETLPPPPWEDVTEAEGQKMSESVTG